MIWRQTDHNFVSPQLATVLRPPSGKLPTRTYDGGGAQLAKRMSSWRSASSTAARIRSVSPCIDRSGRPAQPCRPVLLRRPKEVI